MVSKKEREELAILIEKLVRRERTAQPILSLLSEVTMQVAKVSQEETPPTLVLRDEDGRLVFEDRYGSVCSIQNSSLATEAALWFGVETPFEGWSEKSGKRGFPRMHLTQDQVIALLPTLTRFAQTGDVYDRKAQ